MISFDHVSKRYGTLNALQDVSFSVPKGQVLGLLGQNGAGKTTAMNILTGCLAPTAGGVSIGGNDVILHPREAKRMIGYLPEVTPVYEEMTVRAYLRFACELKEVERKAIPAHVETVAEKTGLFDVLDRKIGNLSKGYRQRTGVAQALCGTPEVIVLDEPTAGLDPRQNSEMRQLILSLAGEHTILFSSHILSEVQALCDRVIILHHGRIVCDSDLNRLRQGESTRLRLDVSGSGRKLLPALEKLPGVLDVNRLPDPAPDTLSVELVHAPGERLQKRLFSLLASLNAPILRLQETEDSLEEVFLRVTGE